MNYQRLAAELGAAVGVELADSRSGSGGSALARATSESAESPELEAAVEWHLACQFDEVLATPCTSW